MPDKEGGASLREKVDFSLLVLSSTIGEDLRWVFSPPGSTTDLDEADELLESDDRHLKDTVGKLVENEECGLLGAALTEEE